MPENVMKILPREDGAYNVMTNVGFHRAQRIVVAAGARSVRLLEPLGIRVPLETERGYHAMLPTPNVALTTTLSNKSRSFGVTPMEHGLRVAGTVEIAGLEAAPDERRAKVCLPISARCSPRWTPTATASGWASVLRHPTACRCWARRQAGRACSSPSATATSA